MDNADATQRVKVWAVVVEDESNRASAMVVSIYRTEEAAADLARLLNLHKPVTVYGVRWYFLND